MCLFARVLGSSIRVKAHEQFDLRNNAQNFASRCSAEKELLLSTQADGAGARDELYKTYFSQSKQVKGLLAREVARPEDREDILHDAYISLIRSKGTFRGDARLQTFIYRVVQIAILQKLRSDRSRCTEKMVRLTVQFDGEDHERCLPVTDYQFEIVEASLAAEKLFLPIPEPLRTTFRLRVTGELSYEEIAAKMHTPINTVATRVFKARAMLARIFGHRCPSHIKSGVESFN
ncbi:MAG: RNA polymerase sigma factor [Bryobacteraceae bacterium]